MCQLSGYDYDLPEALIAQVPCKNRSDSRLMRIQKNGHAISHHRFVQLPDLLHRGDLLVLNNTRVIPARLMGEKSTGGRAEVLIIDYANGLQHLENTGSFQCKCLVKVSRTLRTGTLIHFADQIRGRVQAAADGICDIRFSGGREFLHYLKTAGRLPLPPYIKREPDTDLSEKDREAYQTVYAQKDGAVAAPTAGLHFTRDLMAQLARNGIETVSITLHVGYGTFMPVRVDDIRDHRIHAEYFSLTRDAAEKINQARALGRRVVAVGTTSVRALEFVSDDRGRVTPGTGMCDLYIYPGFQYKCVNAMITNFHLPKSTLLMLVSAFYDRQRMLDAYETAVAQGYRFFSYGDAMLIE